MNIPTESRLSGVNANNGINTDLLLVADNLKVKTFQHLRIKKNAMVEKRNTTYSSTGL